MEIVNYFEDDVFGQASMSAALSKQDTKPDRLGRMGLFVPDPIRTKTVGIECYNGSLQLVPLSQRGSAIPRRTDGKRTVRHFESVRVAQSDTIMADQLAFVNQLVGSAQVKSLQSELARRQMGPDGLVPNIETTHELLRLGALRGQLLDTHGAVLYNFYDEFGITEPATIFLDLANTAEGDLREKIEDTIVRPMKRGAKGARFTGIGALCGESAWGALNKHPEIREAKKGTAAAQELLQSTIDTVVPFAGVEWEEYFGTDDNTTVALAPDEIIFFPKGSSGIFRHVVSPGEEFSHLGELGLPWYSRVIPDRDRNTSVELEVLTYPLYLNTRPEMVRKAQHDAA